VYDCFNTWHVKERRSFWNWGIFLYLYFALSSKKLKCLILFWRTRTYGQPVASINKLKYTQMVTTSITTYRIFKSSTLIFVKKMVQLCRLFLFSHFCILKAKKPKIRQIECEYTTYFDVSYFRSPSVVFSLCCLENAKTRRDDKVQLYRPFVFSQFEAKKQKYDMA
jgi:hypothetical protein